MTNTNGHGPIYSTQYGTTTTVQLTFDEAVRNEAIRRVDEHADPDWKLLALEAVKLTCQTLEEFMVDDVWEIGALPNTREDRALGAVMRNAARLGWCVKTDRVRPSKRSHLSGKPVWRSQLYRGH